MRFTHTSIKRLKPKAERYEVFEDGRPGFGLRVSPKGKKSWFWLYRYQGRSRRVTFGSYPAIDLHTAHLKHAEAQKLLSQGLDPCDLEQSRKEQERGAPTVATLMNEYIERHAKPNKRLWWEDERMLAKDVLPVWGRRKARDIRRRDVIMLLDEIIERGSPITANRLLAILRKMFNFALERDMIENTPMVAIRPPTKETPRERALSENEIKAFWLGLDRIRTSESIKLALKFVLLTGQRKGEVLAAKWEQFDLDKAAWTLPGTVTKNGRTHVVPLSPQAMAILRQCVAGEYVFISKRGEPLNGSSVARLLKNKQAVFDIPHFTAHDLRRTAASGMAALGIPRLVISKVLNHAEREITAIYDRHSYDREKRQALEAWGRKVEQIIEGMESAEVVLFQR